MVSRHGTYLGNEPDCRGHESRNDEEKTKGDLPLPVVGEFRGAIADDTHYETSKLVNVSNSIGRANSVILQRA